jgi:hypothetical protein
MLLNYHNPVDNVLHVVAKSPKHIEPGSGMWI